jgi:DNA-directed RNA polymerase sigma subunit (sigma70/sigma32)
MSDRNKTKSLEGVAPEFTDEELTMLTLMLYTSSFTMVASMMKVSQVRVRYVYNKCLKKIREAGRYDIYEIFNIIRRELNIVRRKFGVDKDERKLPLVM